MSTSVQLKILNPLIHQWGLPKYQTPMSAAFDLIACIVEPISIYPGEVAKIPTGMAIYLGNPNLAGLILPRSGLGLKGLILANTTGLIDADYQGEIIILAWNRSHENIVITPGMRIAQYVAVPIVRCEFEVVEEFHEITERGSLGFGSTGHI
ncbi:MAG: dUTP diphosphatase [Gammaproteobacteria bacterium]|nr:dUTP diphosphatase [Gammaproteobacteria bacterium]